MSMFAHRRHQHSSQLLAASPISPSLSVSESISSPSSPSVYLHVRLHRLGPPVSTSHLRLPLQFLFSTCPHSCPSLSVPELIFSSVFMLLIFISISVFIDSTRPSQFQSIAHVHLRLPFVHVHIHVRIQRLRPPVSISIIIPVSVFISVSVLISLSGCTVKHSRQISLVRSYQVNL